MKTLLKLAIALSLVGVLSACSHAEGTVTRKIKIRSADPLLIAMILSGKYTFDLSPEPTSLLRLSDIGGFGGGGFGNGSGAGNNFGGSGHGGH